MKPKNSPAMLNVEGATSEAQLLGLMALRVAGLPSRKLLRLFLSDEAKPTELPLDLPTDIDCYCEMIKRARPLAEEELARCRQAGITLLPYFASDYPTALYALGGARPVLLYAKGDLGLLQSPASILGIVGTRQPSPEGLAAARRIAYEEAEKGRVILSGLAYGCDAAAHHGALEATGRTIAVIATGLDRAHPEAHQALQDRIIASGGLVLSEYPLATPVGTYRLVARDRLQAALSAELLVIECGVQSGTMHTVRFAERYRRPIFALPPHTDRLPSLEGNRQLLLSGRAKPW
mgnify:FL=1